MQATGDPRTVYRGALAMHRALTGSRMVTLDGARIHSVFGNYGNVCVDDTVIGYLRDGVLPSTDLTC
ncbi:alpha/beta hydrolase [Micromonospora sp. CPCC 206061]|uniref:alpha/beta hydrolase n=1 Tax=Micromonospora sp. CPCC 206061 TaxID=3122410 RepID=UPI002FF3534D